jgi:hypothetical protein
MARRHRKPPNGGDVTRERQPQLTRREVPDLDDAVPGTGCEPLVARLDGDAAHPSQVPGNNAHELPWGMVRWLDGACRFVQRECLRELGRIGERRHPLLGCRVDGSYHSRRLGRWPRGYSFAHLFGARWPNWDLLAYEGGGKLLVVFVFIIHFYC